MEKRVGAAGIEAAAPPVAVRTPYGGQPHAFGKHLGIRLVLMPGFSEKALVGCASGQFEGPVIVAMAAVRVVQMAIDEIVRVVAMRNRFMAAVCAVDMIRSMAAALVVRSAAVRICGGDFDSVLIDMVAVDMVKMAVVQIVDMPGVMDGDMAAIAAMLVAVVGVVGKSAGGHD